MMQDNMADKGTNDSSKNISPSPDIGPLQPEKKLSSLKPDGTLVIFGNDEINNTMNWNSIDSSALKKNINIQQKESQSKIDHECISIPQKQDLNVIPEAQTEKDDQTPISGRISNRSIQQPGPLNTSLMPSKIANKNTPNILEIASPSAGPTASTSIVSKPRGSILVPNPGNKISFLTIMKNVVQAENPITLAGRKKSGFANLIDLLAMRRNKEDNNDYPINKTQLQMLQDKSLGAGVKYNNDKTILRRKSNIFSNLQQAKKAKKKKGWVKKLKECILCKKRRKRRRKNTRTPLKAFITSNQLQQISYLNGLCSGKFDELKLHLKKKFKMPPLIAKPESPIRIFWDILSMLLINYQLLMIPFQLSFDYIEPIELTKFEFFVDLFFLIDIIFTMNTGYTDETGLVMDRKKIISNYLKGWFWIDLLSSFPYSWLDGQLFADGSSDTVAANSNSSSKTDLLAKVQLVRLIRFLRFLKILRLLRVIKLSRLFNKFEGFVKISMTLSGIIGFMKLSAFILYLSHWLGCAWHYLGISQINTTPDTWLSSFGILDESWDIRYVTSIYWAVTTMVTIGYGDIKPITNSEKALAIIAMIMSCCVFAFVINRMNILIEQIEYTAFIYRSKMRSFTNQLRSKEVKPELIAKIKRYMEYYFAEQKSFSSEETKLLSLLSFSLKDELITQIYAQIISKIPFLMDNFSRAFLAALSYSVKELNCGPGEEIWTEAVDDKSLYYIYSGEIVMCISKLNTEVKIITAGLHFGEIAFFTGLCRQLYAKSKEYSRLFKISRNDFVNLIERYPKDKEKFYMIKDKILVYQNYEDLKITCYSCKIPNHLLIDCPLLHFTKDRTYMLTKYLDKQETFFKTYARRDKKKILFA